VTRIQKT